MKKHGRRTALVVPLHRELKLGTLAGILRDADLSPEELRSLLCIGLGGERGSLWAKPRYSHVRG